MKIVEIDIDDLEELFKEDERIENDPHTNKHYDLIKGKMWMKGNGCGMRWELYCNSRDGQYDAREILGLG